MTKSGELHVSVALVTVKETQHVCIDTPLMLRSLCSWGDIFK
jgi:hypothetical protein